MQAIPIRKDRDVLFQLYRRYGRNIRKNAEVAYRTVIPPGGEKRTLLMCKGEMTGNQWIGSQGGKILKDPGNGELEEIGLVEWRLIKLELGSYMSIMMTKSLAKKAKWQGRFNGVLYLDK
jgi:hypothetical protein